MDHGHLWRPVEVGQPLAVERTDRAQGRLERRVDRDRVRCQLIAVVIVGLVRVDHILVEALVVGLAQVGSHSTIRLRHCWVAERRAEMLGPVSRSDSCK